MNTFDIGVEVNPHREDLIEKLYTLVFITQIFGWDLCIQDRGSGLDTTEKTHHRHF